MIIRAERPEDAAAVRELVRAAFGRDPEAVLVDRLSASAALRRTQLESAATGKTYEWAAFSLYGWPDSSI